MAKPRTPNFKPHVMAAALRSAGLMSSDGTIVHNWSDTHWAPVGDNDAERAAYHWIEEHAPGFESAENARKAHRATLLCLPPLPEPTTQCVIPTLSGYLHLDGEEPELLPADPKLGVTHVLNCVYDPTCPAPELFMALLARALPDAATRARVQEYIGYTLVPHARYQRAQIWIGPGANGKGVIANVVQALHGKVAAVSLDDLSGFSMSGCISASLIYVDEIPRRQIDEQRLKTAIAGETILVDRKYREALTLQLRGKWLILGNSLPAITDHSAGFWRRFDIVPFKVVIPEAERDPMLAELIIASELAGVLNWALEGLQRLRARGRFDPVMPAQMAAAISSAKAETNSVVAWGTDVGLELSTQCRTPKEAVFEAYTDWCAANAMRAVSSPRFWIRLNEHLPGIEYVRVRTMGGKQCRRCNVELHSPSATEPTEPSVQPEPPGFLF